MRDQWRAEEDYRDARDCRERHYRERRRPSPARPTLQRGGDRGEKSKNRVSVDYTAPFASRLETLGENRSSQREVGRKRSRSPERRVKGEVQTKHLEKSSEKSEIIFTKRLPYQGGTKPPVGWNTSHSPSPQRGSFSCREERRRSRSPARSARHSRERTPISRRREQPDSPLSLPRLRRYTSYDDNPAPTKRPPRHFYIPSGRPSSTTPERSRNTSPIRPRSRSTRRRPDPRKGSPIFARGASHREHISRRHRESASYTYSRDPQFKDTSNQNKTCRQRRQSLSPSPTQSKRSDRNNRSFRAAIEPESPSAKTKEMQSTTQPIQSVLDDNPHPPSPPQPIPSFDSDSHSGGVREAFSSHGLKPTELHAGIRPGRPQVDTRQSYSTSPQWTPTSSHHGSPQSGSPFSRGRGGWGGQQQHFHGQPR